MNDLLTAVLTCVTILLAAVVAFTVREIVEDRQETRLINEQEAARVRRERYLS